MPRVLSRPLALICLTMALALGLALAQPLVSRTAANAVIATPKTKSFAAGIDAYGAYQGQTTCSATSKKGSLYVKDLLNATYGTRTIGIVRSCSSGGTSEHKEGRALDWMISASKSSEKAIADSFIQWLLATDKYGNKHAMARRMGVMYIIWNNKMWRAYDPGRGWTDYKGCTTSSTLGATTCHRDHVHISLTWDGANAKTSMYTGGVAYQVAANVSTKTAAVGDTVTISGSVSPVVGSAGKTVSIKRRVDGTSQYLSAATIDSAGRYSYSYKVTDSDPHRFVVYKASEGCTSSGCSYGSGTSSEVGFVVEGPAAGILTTSLSAYPTLLPEGYPVSFEGRVTPANVVAGQQASLKSIDPVSGDEVYHKPVTLRSDGTFETTVVPPSTGVHRFFIYKAGVECGADGCAYPGASSERVSVEVRASVPYTVSASSSATSVPVGGAVTVAGKVGPSWAAPGTKVVVRDTFDGVITVVGSASITSASTYSVKVRPAVAGTHSYKIYKAADSCVDSTCDFTAAWSAAMVVNAKPIVKLSATAGATRYVLPRKGAALATTFSPAVGVKGASVAVQKRTAGVWKRVATRTADANGRVAFSAVQPTAGTSLYRFVAPPTVCGSGVCQYSGGTSGTSTVRVLAPDTHRPTIVAKAASTAMVGSTITVSGSVSPAAAFVGQTVSIQVQKNGVFTYLKSARVGADGRFSAPVSASTKGQQTFRVYRGALGCSASGCLWKANSSNWMRVSVS